MSKLTETSSPQPKRLSVVVLGAGVIGVTTAYFLQKAGFDVTVVERNNDVGQGTSKANGGLVSVGCSHPWNSPAVPMTVFKSWGKVDSPFLFRAAAFPGVIPWAYQYLMQCRHDAYHNASIASVCLLSESLRQLRAVVAETQLEYDQLRNGVLKFFKDPDEVKKDAAHAAQLASFGLEYRELTRDQVIETEPFLEAQASHIGGGLYFPSDESGDACKFTQALARQCEKNGVKFKLNTEIKDIEIERSVISGIRTDKEVLTADRYVLAMGVFSKTAGQKLGLKLPVYPVKGYSVTIETHGDIPLPKVPFIDWGRKMGVTAFGTRIRAGGTAEFTGYNTDPTPERWGVLHRNLLELFPGLQNSPHVTPWAGLRPVTPDGMPVIGRSPIDNLFLNTGHGPQGWGLSCGSAALLTDIMIDAKPRVSTKPFEYERF
jgi:D-amino-acid dehydrogenase